MLHLGTIRRAIFKYKGDKGRWKKAFLPAAHYFSSSLLSSNPARKSTAASPASFGTASSLSRSTAGTTRATLGLEGAAAARPGGPNAIDANAVAAAGAPAEGATVAASP